jgi:hypothetical protein
MKNYKLWRIEIQKKSFMLIVTIIIFSISILCISCDTSTIGNSKINGSGNIITEARSVNGYISISFSGAGELNITQGMAESLNITTDDNLMDYIETTVENGVLKIKFREGVSLEPSNTNTFDIVVIDLNGIVFSGAGTIQADTLDVSSGTFDLLVSGVADCIISGHVDHQNIIISGTCSFEAPDFESMSATVNVSGVGDVTLWVSDNLNGSISGVGNVYYWGSPGTVENINITGKGKVVKLGTK